jgi:putative chitinase
MAFSFEFTKDQLQQIIPNNAHLDHWFEALDKILPDYEIDTPQRVAAFLAQCAHESGGFNAIQENLNYRPETLMKLFGSHFPGGLAEAQQYCAQPNKQEVIANRIYADRMGNGPESSGDGWAFCGRGLIQLTGRANYTRFAQSIDTPVEQVTEFLQTFEGCVQSACWFWEANNLNQYADNGDILTMTKRINGGTLGLEDRKAHYQHALQVFGVA